MSLAQSSKSLYPRRSRTVSRHRHGAVSVEFAACLTVLVLFTFAAFEFARLSMVRHTVGNAAYDAARNVLVPGGTVAEAKSNAVAMLAAVGLKGATVTVTPDPLNDTTAMITVTVSVPMNSNSWIAPSFSSGKVVTSTVRLMTERPPGVQMRGLPTAPTSLPPLPFIVDPLTDPI